MQESLCVASRRRHLPSSRTRHTALRMHYLLLAFSLLAMGCESRNQPPKFVDRHTVSIDHAMGAVMDSSTGRLLLDQCSRSSPHLVRGFWTPTDREITDLEVRLASSLDSALRSESAGGSAHLRPGDYYRQYVGVIHWTGRRTIYVNGFHEHYARARRLAYKAEGKKDTLEWRREPIAACDGGVMFFGAEYDPASKQVSGVLFNGTITSPH